MIRANNLTKYFYQKSLFGGKKGDVVKAVDDVSFYIPKGETFGLVGESGAGKSTVAKIACGIIKPDEGDIISQGDIDIVFQDPFSSLNPRMTVRDIVGECLLVRGLGRDEIEERVKDTLKLVRLRDPRAGLKYPHQFSGGERQRVAIARAIIRRPELLILDEPVSSLDVSIQAEILNLLKDLQEGLELTYLFVSHDLRVVEFMSQTVGVMRQGKLVEVASREAIYASPQHPYTKHLLASIPRI